MKVNKRQLADIVGVTEQVLTNQQKEGPSVAAYADKNGFVNECDTVVAIRWLLRRELERLNREKLCDRLDRVKAELTELERGEELGQLALAVMSECVWGDHILTVRMEFLMIPEQLAAEPMAASGVEMDPDIIAAYINRALEKLSNYGVENDGDGSRNHTGADG